MSIEADRERLSQAHNLAWIRRAWKPTDMVPVYRWTSENVRQDYFILSGLISSQIWLKRSFLEQHVSDDRIENVWPEPAAYCPPGESKIQYFRWGVEENIYGSEPLVIGRRFSGVEDELY